MDLKYGDITEKIIGCSFEVHKFLGNACLPVGRGFKKCFTNVLWYMNLKNPALTFPGKLSKIFFIRILKNPSEQEELTL